MRAGLKVELFHLNGTKFPEIKIGIWKEPFFTSRQSATQQAHCKPPQISYTYN